MKLFDDIVLLELQKEEWSKESEKSPIIRPDMVKEREEGLDKTRVPYHFFKVIAVGPKCKKVKIGNRVFPKPPTLHSQGHMQMMFIWVEGKKEARFILREEDIAGVE